MDTDLLTREWIGARLARVDVELQALRGRMAAFIERMETRFDELTQRLDARHTARPDVSHREDPDHAAGGGAVKPNGA